MLRLFRHCFVVAVVVGFAGATSAQPAAKKLPAAAATSELALIPADSELVLGLDFQQIQSSGLWKQFVEPQLAKGDTAKQMAEFKATCGIEPMKVLTKVTMGLKGVGGTSDPDGVIVAQGVSKSKLLPCFEKMSKQKKPGTTITRDGDVVIVKNGTDAPVAFAFANETTAVMVLGTNATVDGMKAALKGTSGLKSSRAFLEIHKLTNTKATLWMIMNGNSKAFDQLAATGVKPKVVFGSVNVTKDLALDARMRFGSADEAKQLATAANGQISAVSSMFDKISVTSVGTDLKINVFLSEAKLKALLSQFGAMMGTP